MKSLLNNTLLKLGYPVYLQGTMSAIGKYPSSFITFLTVYSQDAANYDDDTRAVQWRFQVAFYSAAPKLIESVPHEIQNALKAAGFIPLGRGRDIPSDVPSHTGWVQDYYALEIIEEGKHE